MFTRSLVRPLSRQTTRLLTAQTLSEKFLPSSLFASSEDGGWWDPSDLTSLRVGRDGSGGQPSVGDPVGQVLDKSGNGNHLVAPSDAARPLAGSSLINYDDVDDSLSVTTPAITNGQIVTVIGSRMVVAPFRSSGNGYRVPRCDWRAILIIDRALTTDEKAAIAAHYGATYEDADFMAVWRATTSAGLSVHAGSGTGYDVNWGDGNTDTGISIGADADHTYSGSGTYLVTVTSDGTITNLRDFDTTADFVLADLPAGLAYYYHSGQNTVSGSLAALPAGLTNYNHSGQNTVVPGVSAWATALRYVRLDGALTQGEVDTLLTNLSAVTTWTNEQTIELRYGGNAARSSAVDAAVATLQGNGVTVNTA